MFYLRNSNDTGYADLTFAYGAAGAGWIPIAGDWNGDGKDTIGLYDPTTSMFYLRNTNDTGYADVTFAYGAAGAGWKPIAGDWNGGGTDTIGLYDPSRPCSYLRNTNDTGYANVTFAFGAAGAGWTPIAGDWNNDGKDTIGLYDPSRSMYFLRNTTSLQGPSDQGYADLAFSLWPGKLGFDADRRRLEWPESGPAGGRRPSDGFPRHAGAQPSRTPTDRQRGHRPLDRRRLGRRHRGEAQTGPGGHRRSAGRLSGRGRREPEPGLHR